MEIKQVKNACVVRPLSTSSWDPNQTVDYCEMPKRRLHTTWQLRTDQCNDEEGKCLADSIGEVGPDTRLSRLNQGLFEGMRVSSKCLLFSCERDHSSNGSCALASKLCRLFVQLSRWSSISHLPRRLSKAKKTDLVFLSARTTTRRRTKPVELFKMSQLDLNATRGKGNPHSESFGARVSK